MQTRKLGLRALTLAMAGVLTLGLAACEETKTVTPVQPSVLTISPTGNVDLFVGDRIQVVANLQNPGTSATVTFTSSNTAVATVDQNGTVTAVAPGIATISASATGNAGETLRQAMTVRVTARDTGGNQGNARVFITGITRANGDPIATDSVAGTVVVRLEVEPGPADSLQVSIGGRRACAISFAAAGALVNADGQEVDLSQVPLTCTVNTATVGVANGATTVTARLFDNNAVIASNQQSITIRNVSTVNTAISAERQATNPNTGLLWQDGAVTVRVTPAIFGGASVQRVTVSLNGAGGAAADTAITDTTATDGVFEVRFPETSTALAGVTTPNLRATITAIAGGEQFRFPVVVDGQQTTATSITTNAIRYDNAAPTITSGRTIGLASGFIGNVNTSTLFGSVNTGARDTTAAGVEGVNAVTVEYFYVQGTDVLAADTVIARGTAFTAGSQLPAGGTFSIAARACDLLRNCRTIGVQNNVRVDVVAPEIADFATPGIEISEEGDTVVFNANTPTTGNIVFELSDDVAGFSGTPLRAAATRTYYNATLERVVTECVIGDEATTATITAAFGSDVAAYRASGGTATDDDDICEPINNVGSQIQVPDAAGYYDFDVFARDVALNVSAGQDLVVLVDQQIPTVTNIDFSASLDGGDEERFSARLQDNLDLYQYNVGAVFNNGVGFIPLTMYTSLDNTFGAPLTRRADVSPNAFFISAIRMDADAGSGFTAGSTGTPNTVVFNVYDQARNEASNGTALSQTFAWSGVDVTGYAVTVPGSNDELCVNMDGCDDAANSKTVRAVVTQDVSATDTAAVRANFYFEIAGSRYLFAVDQTATTSISTSSRSFTFEANVTREMVVRAVLDLLAAGVLNQDDIDDIDGATLPIFVIAIDEDGNGIMQGTDELVLETDD